MPKLERDGHAGGYELEKRVELLDADPRVRRQLHEHRTQARAECCDSTEKIAGFFAAILELLDVTQAARRLDGEAKTFRHLRSPAFEHARFRHAIERVVDLDARKPRAVEREHLVGRQLLRIERPFPLLERKDAGAPVEIHFK